MWSNASENPQVPFSPESSSFPSSYTCSLDPLPSYFLAAHETVVAVNRDYISNTDNIVPFGGLFKSLEWNEEVGKICRVETEKRVREHKA